MDKKEVLPTLWEVLKNPNVTKTDKLTATAVSAGAVATVISGGVVVATVVSKVVAKGMDKYYGPWYDRKLKECYKKNKE